GGAAGDPDLPHRACATSAHEPEETCSGVEAQPLANPTSVADEMYNLVLESEWTALWGVVGQYACGDAPVYRGSFSADTTDGEADWPDAIASLVMGEGIDWIATSRQGPHLTVFDPVSGRKTRLVQQVLGTTETSIIAEQNSSFGVGASCTDCFVDLETRPERIEFDYVANGEYGDGSPLMISASGWFEQIRPGEVTFSDIQTVTNVYSSAIQDIRQSFETCGAELIRRSAGEYRIPAPAPAGSGFRDNQCARAVFFSATWHLDADQPAAHGIRALTIDEPRYCCQDLNGETGPVRSECYDP
ncbi:MAG TPA: hypothetical protein VGK73_35360, partial [Polyangiaceae bacterium]